jgi:hypothetical protein
MNKKWHESIEDLIAENDWCCEEIDVVSTVE